MRQVERLSRDYRLKENVIRCDAEATLDANAGDSSSGANRKISGLGLAASPVQITDVYRTDNPSASEALLSIT
jgi:hypothetical protein